MRTKRLIIFGFIGFFKSLLMNNIALPTSLRTQVDFAPPQPTQSFFQPSQDLSALNIFISPQDRERIADFQISPADRALIDNFNSAASVGVDQYGFPIYDDEPAPPPTLSRFYASSQPASKKNRNPAAPTQAQEAGMIIGSLGGMFANAGLTILSAGNPGMRGMLARSIGNSTNVQSMTGGDPSGISSGFLTALSQGGEAVNPNPMYDSYGLGDTLNYGQDLTVNNYGTARAESQSLGSNSVYSQRSPAEFLYNQPSIQRASVRAPVHNPQVVRALDYSAPLEEYALDDEYFGDTPQIPVPTPRPAARATTAGVAQRAAAPKPRPSATRPSAAAKPAPKPALRPTTSSQRQVSGPQPSAAAATIVYEDY